MTAFIQLLQIHKLFVWQDNSVSYSPKEDFALQSGYPIQEKKSTLFPSQKEHSQSRILTSKRIQH